MAKCIAAVKRGYPEKEGPFVTMHCNHSVYNASGILVGQQSCPQGITGNLYAFVKE